MATLKTKDPTISNITKALGQMGYKDVFSMDPFYEVKGKHIIFYVVTGIDRRKFINDLSTKFNEKKYNIASYYEGKTNGNPKSSMGRVKFVDSDTAIVCKPNKKGEIKLKPSNITPSIVDDWLIPEVVAENVKTYIKNSNAPKPLEDQIIFLIDESLTTKRDCIIPGDVDEVMVPAEFMEILTAIKMAVLLRNNDTSIRKILKLSSKVKLTRSSPIKIHIPKKANFPLTDYEIAYLPNDYKETCKVSVKSKVKGDNTNTLKFPQIFDSVSDVNLWYNKLSASLKKEQYGPAQIALSALTFSSQSAKGNKGKAATKKAAAIPPKPAEKYAGKVKVGFPIDAVGQILEMKGLNLDKVILARSSISDGSKKRGPTSTEVRQLGIICRRIHKLISGLNTEQTIDSVFKNSKSAAELDMVGVVSNFISTNNQVNNKPARPDLINLGKFCEKILEWASKEQSQTKFNFWEMFRKKVLEERAICYAITESEKMKTSNGINTKIKYGYYSIINWEKEYSKVWVGLRKKDGDALGLDL